MDIKTIMKNEKIINIYKEYKLEILIWFSYIILLSVVSYFHEPWYDEAESWQIARCASYKEILFSVPHFEGHPQLWHLILSIPAKLGLPYEMSLKIIGIFFSSFSAFLIIFLSPFRKIYRCCIPFTYFTFYQYGVVVRTYCVMGVVFMFMAITFKNRNQKPFRFVITLFLLCLTSAYGIAIAGGIALAWVFELIKEKGLRKCLEDFVKDNRILSLGLLLISSIPVVYCITPKSETMATELVYNNRFIERLIYAIFGSISDSIVTDVLSTYIQDNNFDIVSLVSVFMIGLIIYLVLYMYSNRRLIMYFLFPFSAFVIMIVNLYFNRHHEGIIYFFVLWYLWINLDAGELMWSSYCTIFKKDDRKKIETTKMIIINIFIVVSILYSLIASVHEIQSPYSSGRQIAEFIKNNGLENEYIMAGWDESKRGNNLEGDTNYVYYIVDISPYFENNLETNLNPTEPWRGYMVHKYSEERNDKNIAALKNKKVPSILIGNPDVHSIYDSISVSDYVPVFEFTEANVNIWKWIYSERNQYIYLRKDLLSKYNLVEIEKKYSFY